MDGVKNYISENPRAVAIGVVVVIAVVILIYFFTSGMKFPALFGEKMSDELEMDSLISSIISKQKKGQK